MKIPNSVLTAPVPGLWLIHRGKVRDTYELDNNLLLVVASDRISIFDFVLPALVKDKGEILTALNIFWVNMLDHCHHDLVAFGKNIDQYLPEESRNNPDLQKRALVVRKLAMVPIEGIIRGFLTGSAFSTYQKIRKSLEYSPFLDGSRFKQPIFDPTTKAEEGHDQPINRDLVSFVYGMEVETLCLFTYNRAQRYANGQGIILADTKLEFGFDSSNQNNSQLILADERFTPDSSRFWDKEDWAQALREGRSPRSMDKQVVRDYGKKLGINKLDPAEHEDLKRVHSMTIEDEILLEASGRYHEIFVRLTDSPLAKFQANVMGINVG